MGRTYRKTWKPWTVDNIPKVKTGKNRKRSAWVEIVWWGLRVDGTKEEEEEEEQKWENSVCEFFLVYLIYVHEFVDAFLLVRIPWTICHMIALTVCCSISSKEYAVICALLADRHMRLQSMKTEYRYIYNHM